MAKYSMPKSLVFLSRVATCIAAFRIGDALVAVLGGHIVVGHRQGQFRAAHLAAGQAQAFKGLGAGDFMDQMAVDIENGRFARALLHQMRVPDLVVQRLAHGLPFCLEVEILLRAAGATGLHIRSGRILQLLYAQTRYFSDFG